MRWLLFWRPAFLLRSVIVNFKDDDSAAIRGVLWSSRGPYYTLVNCSLLKVGATTALDGTIYVPRANVLFLQEPPA